MQPAGGVAHVRLAIRDDSTGIDQYKLRFANAGVPSVNRPKNVVGDGLRPGRIYLSSAGRFPRSGWRGVMRPSLQAEGIPGQIARRVFTDHDITAYKNHAPDYNDNKTITSTYYTPYNNNKCKPNPLTKNCIIFNMPSISNCILVLFQF